MCVEGCGVAYVMQPVDDPARRTFNAKPKWEVSSQACRIYDFSNV